MPTNKKQKKLAIYLLDKKQLEMAISNPPLWSQEGLCTKVSYCSHSLVSTGRVGPQQPLADKDSL